MKKRNKLSKILHKKLKIKKVSFLKKMSLTRDMFNLKIIIKLVQVLKNWK